MVKGAWERNGTVFPAILFAGIKSRWIFKLRFKGRSPFGAAGAEESRFKKENDIPFKNVAKETAKNDEVFQASQNTINGLISTYNCQVIMNKISG